MDRATMMAPRARAHAGREQRSGSPPQIDPTKRALRSTLSARSKRPNRSGAHPKPFGSNSSAAMSANRLTGQVAFTSFQVALGTFVP